MAHKVSVLIPTYNYAHYLNDAIQSVLQQTFTDFELIIVDDCSTDNTDAVVQQYLSDPRISYYKNERNLGLAANFNKCLEYAQGEYIKYLLADDKFHPQLLEEFVPVMEKYPNVILVTSYNEMFGVSNSKRTAPFTGMQEGKKVIQASLKKWIDNWIGEPSVVMFRKAGLKVGHFDTAFHCLVDIDMWLRLLTIGDCYIIPKTLSYFRTHPNQASKLVLKNYAYTFENYLFYKKLKENNSYQIPFEQWEQDKALARSATYCADVTFRLFYKLHNRNNRLIFKKAFTIAFREKVFHHAVLKLLKATSNKASELLSLGSARKTKLREAKELS